MPVLNQDDGGAARPIKGAHVSAGAMRKLLDAAFWAWLPLLVMATVAAGVITYPENGPGHHLAVRHYRAAVVGTAFAMGAIFLVILLPLQTSYNPVSSWRKRR